MAQYKQYKEALGLIQEQKFQKALELYNHALEAQPDDPDILNDRAVCYYHLNKYVLALQDMTRAVELQPDYSYRYAARAYIKGAMKDTHGAIADYEKAVELDPEDAVAHNNLGMLQEQLGYDSQAKKNFNVADELAGILKEQNISVVPDKPEPNFIEPDPEPSSPGDTIRSVFTSKSAFSEFLRFVANGFKLKK